MLSSQLEMQKYVHQCDDLCRTEECLYDGGDCDNGCINDVCYTFYYWWRFGVEERHKMNITDFCAENSAFLALQTDMDQYGGCPAVGERFDFNNDDAINFREFVAAGYILIGGDEEKGWQMNCSDCTGMEFYNI